MPVIKANGVDLYYEQAGERGSPVLLVHGGWLDHRYWNPVVPGLARSFRVVSYDRRGQGRSERVATPGSAEEDGRDASALLEALGMSPAHIVGHSTGSIVVLKMAATQPRVFRSLVAHEPPLIDLLADDPATLAGLKERRKAVTDLLERGDREGGARLFVETTSSGPGGWERLPPPVRQAFVENTDAILDEMRNPSDAGIDLRALARFGRPAMLSVGEKSPPVMQTIVGRVAKAIPGSTLFTYVGAGHMAPSSHPEEFVRATSEFMGAGR